MFLLATSSGHAGHRDFLQERPVGLIPAYANLLSFLLCRVLSLALGFLKLINSQMNFTFAYPAAGPVFPSAASDGGLIACLFLPEWLLV